MNTGDFFRLEKSKHPADTLNTGSQHIYLFFSIIQTKRSTYSSLNPHTNHQRLCAMMPGTHSNAQAVKQRTHIQMMNISYQERNDTALVTGLSEDTHPVYFFQTLHSILCQFMLMGGNIFHTEGRYIIQRFCQAVVPI